VVETMDGFEVTYSADEIGTPYDCRLCAAGFTVDQRGLPLLTHPELGPIVVCYRCAVELGEERSVG
jgi:hypothetical protein